MGKKGKGRSRPEIGLYYRSRQIAKNKKAGKPVYPKGSSYSDRTDSLLKLGFESYTHYLQSDLWKRIRSSAYSVHGNKCKLCKGRAQNIHHLDYAESTLLGEDLIALVPLCRSCHEKVELTDTGEKRSMMEARAEYWKMHLQVNARF